MFLAVVAVAVRGPVQSVTKSCCRNSLRASVPRAACPLDVAHAAAAAASRIGYTIVHATDSRVLILNQYEPLLLLLLFHLRIDECPMSAS